ncbi:MAG TPA: inorganic diphosphatase [Spirochaetia bacterium]|nr:inorganic diphosphatase [Spirochaetia bacterium]
MNSKSLEIAKQYLGKKVLVKMDRKLGEIHPKWGFVYSVNYGFIPGTVAPDGEELDAYVLKVEVPLEEFEGEVVAIVHRTDNDDDKLVVVPAGEKVSDEEIEKLTEFQEKWFKHEIVR